MKAGRIIALILVFIGSCSNGSQFSEDTASSLRDLLALSNRNLNHESCLSNDSLLIYCDKIKVQHLMDKEMLESTRFLVQQIRINANCQKGNMGVSILQARELYDKTGKLDNPYRLVLSLQAIGNTYQYSGRYKEADELYTQAESHLRNDLKNIIKVRLYLQHAYVLIRLEQPDRAQACLAQVEKILPKLKVTPSLISFYLQVYQTFCHIQRKEKEEAEILFKAVMAMNNESEEHLQLLSELSIDYYTFTKEYEKALACYATLEQEVDKECHPVEYRTLIRSKAALHRKIGREEEACTLYQEYREMSKPEVMTQYSETLDSVRATYVIDQLELTNVKRERSLLTSGFILSVCILLVVVLLVAILRKKNEKLKQSRAQLIKAGERASRSILSKSLCLSNMSHDIRTPLNAIVGFSELLSLPDEEIDRESKKLFGDNIIQNADMLLKLLNDAINMSTMEEDLMSFVVEPCDIVSMCRQVVNTVDKVKHTSAEIKFETTLAEFELNTDSTRLQQVLINLLTNAVKFTPQGSITLRLELDQTQNEMSFIVEDTGCGIPPERQESVFERFEKLQENVQGTGLGLSICRFIVHKLGGRIWVDPHYTSGARFIFTHPLEPTSTPL